MIIKLLNEVILEEEKKKRGTPAEISSWRSSGLGTCMRGRFLHRLLSGTGIRPEPDARTLRVFEIGNQVEDWLVKNLEKHPEYKLLTQVEFYDPTLNLSGHCDGIIYREGSTEKPIMLECKSKHSKAFWYMDKKGEGAQIHHRMQLHSYLYMLNKYGGKLYTGRAISPKSIDVGYLVYVSKDDMAMLEYPVYLADTELEKMWKFEIETLNKCWNDQTAPPKNEEGTWQEKYCEYCKAGLCQELTDDKVKELFKIRSTPPAE